MDNTSDIYKDKFIPIRVKGGRIYSFFKRLTDIILSIVGIIVSLLLMIVIGIVIKLTSKGPIIYKSIRVGKNGKEFTMYKFRSMYNGAENKLDELKDKNEIKGGVTFKMKNDPRVTPFGKFIRKTSLDELPQLFNILAGSMSIIGPRAAIPSEVEKYTDYQKQRLLVPQGLSGEWQTHGRSKTTFEQMIEKDLDYIQNKRGFFYDIKLMFLTLWCVITHKGAE